VSIKRFGKSAARKMLHQGGALRGVRQWNRRGYRILMYHDFADAPGMQEALARQCDHIRRHYNVVTLTDIAAYLREGASLPDNALAVTVDDGGRDFLLTAHPIFKTHGIPVIVYLVSGFLDKKLWLWWDQVHLVVEGTPRTSFQFSLAPGLPPTPFIIETMEQRRQACETIKEAMKKLREAERIEILSGLPRLLDVELPHEPPPHMAPLAWSEVRHLAQNGVEIGAHTVTHPILSRIMDPAELLQEIGESKKRIEEELHQPVRHFCYPYGRLAHFNEDTVKAVEKCGFHTSVTAEPGLNFDGAHPFQLKRLAVEPGTPELYFQEQLAGLHSP